MLIFNKLYLSVFYQSTSRFKYDLNEFGLNGIVIQNPKYKIQNILNSRIHYKNQHSRSDISSFYGIHYTPAPIEGEYLIVCRSVYFKSNSRVKHLGFQF